MYYYKKGGSFIITKHMLEEDGPLPEGVTPSTQEAYEESVREQEEALANLRATPGYARSRELQELHRNLEKSDYKAIKFAEGLISEEDYAPIRAAREAIRERIRELEKEEEDAKLIGSSEG